MGQWSRQGRTSILGMVDDPRTFLAEMIIRNQGNLMKTAHEIGVHRVTLYTKIDEYGLWPFVNRARHQRAVEKAISSRPNS